MAKREPRSSRKILCPTSRNIWSKTCAHKYIGFLTLLEFDIIDVFLSEKRTMTFDMMANRLDKPKSNIDRFMRDMRVANLIGCVFEEQPTSNRFSEVKYWGPTMLATHLWHDAVSEDWEWEDYCDEEWIYRKDVHRGTAKGDIREARSVWCMAQHLPYASQASGHRTAHAAAMHGSRS